ncbi:hypothetical protein AVL48_28465 [Amycolatopsis regifaucium]|uniref:Transcriptional regulator LacI/GalR-like sensor domain-containing protein n=1 Tax=Amycolatopsis regifaucium TaxID=546365 RepID=A0A154MPU9_9PSEU|nr:hypothetical protein AVL48_28465 [Amycolatopsis regifaucium]SFH78817.1 substrate-binding protein-like domain-containing protein [Amycolatopsis regifaucium]
MTRGHKRPRAKSVKASFLTLKVGKEAFTDLSPAERGLRRDHAEHVVQVTADGGEVTRFELADPQFVDFDQASGAIAATRHLLDLGHETVWHVAGPPESYAAERRRKSWQQTLEEDGREVPPPLIGDWSSRAGYEYGVQLAGDPEVTAVFAANDQMALGLLRALHEKGRSVPRDVSVVGFDDMDEAAHLWPPLTTVRQSFDEVGKRAVAALLAEITDAGTAGAISVPTEPVVRSSTAAPGPQ